MFELTVRFDTWSELIAYAQANAGRIDPADVPSVGAPEAPVGPPVFPPAVAPDPVAVFEVFGGPAAPPVPVTISVQELASVPLPLTGPELDVTGLPWDERIHSSTRAKIADGSWRQKRGMKELDPDGSLRRRVESELRAHLGQAPAAPITQIASDAVVVPPAPRVVPVAPAVPAPPVAAVPTPPPAPTAPAATQAWTFPRLLLAVSAGGPAGIAAALPVIQQFGPQSMPELAVIATTQPDLCGQIALALGLS